METTTYTLDSPAALTSALTATLGPPRSEVSRHICAEIPSAIYHLQRWDLSLVLYDDGHASLNEPTEDGTRPLMIWKP